MTSADAPLANVATPAIMAAKAALLLMNDMTASPQSGDYEICTIGCVWRSRGNGRLRSLKTRCW
jgi:hypothetical protein